MNIEILRSILLSNTLVLCILGISWSKNGWMNLLAKMSLLALCFANLFYALRAFGWVVRGN